jgi:hypothetical protein
MCGCRVSSELSIAIIKICEKRIKESEIELTLFSLRSSSYNYRRKKTDCKETASTYATGTAQADFERKRASGAVRMARNAMLILNWFEKND